MYQKTARKPVVQYTEAELSLSLDTLKKKGLISTVVGGGSRVVKYKHNLAIVYPLVPEQLVVLALLFLRGPLTAGEINNASGRMYEFTDLQHVSQVMENLAESQPTYLIKLPKAAGQKEARFAHGFQPLEDIEKLQTISPQTLDSSGEKTKELEERVIRLEEELRTLKNAFDSLISELS